MLILSILFFSMAFIAFCGSSRFNHLGQYHLRKCQGKSWRTGFPNVSKRQIRSFLNCLVFAMDFDEKDYLKFNPNDKVVEIYRSIYGGKTPFCDDMECERLVMELSEEFKVKEEKFHEAWVDENITLGDLFRIAQG